MYKLRLVLINSSEDPLSSEDRAQCEIPENFEIPEGSVLVRWMDSPVVPNPGQHMWLGCDNLANKITEVIYVPDELDYPYWEVHFYINTELEMLIAYGNPRQKHTGYPEFSLDDRYFDTD